MWAFSLGCETDVAIGYTTGLAAEKPAECWSRSLFGWEDALLSQSDLPFHSGLSFWPCICTIFARGASNWGNNTCRMLSLGISCNIMYDSLRKHLTCWHFLNVALLPEHRNASYQWLEDRGSTGWSLSQSASATCSVQPLMAWGWIHIAHYVLYILLLSGHFQNYCQVFPVFLGKRLCEWWRIRGLSVGEVTLVFGLNSKDKLPHRNAHFHHRNTPTIKSFKRCDRPTGNVNYPRVAQNEVKHHQHGG